METSGGRLVQGLNASVKDAILSQAGADSFSVQQFPISFSEEEAEKFRYNPRLTAADAQAIKRFSPMVAAVTTTAGNLLLTGELNGDFVAFDARNGDVLYRFNTGGPVGGGVVTYAAGGRQYIAVASGSPSNFWVERNPGSPTIVVFALPPERR